MASLYVAVSGSAVGLLAYFVPKEQRVMNLSAGHSRGLSMQFQLDLLRESLGEFGFICQRIWCQSIFHVLLPSFFLIYNALRSSI